MNNPRTIQDLQVLEELITALPLPSDMPLENGNVAEYDVHPSKHANTKREVIIKRYALVLGADDCVGKPFHARESVVRIRAKLKRVRQYCTCAW